MASAAAIPVAVPVAAAGAQVAAPVTPQQMLAR